MMNKMMSKMNRFKRVVLPTMILGTILRLPMLQCEYYEEGVGSYKINFSIMDSLEMDIDEGNNMTLTYIEEMLQDKAQVRSANKMIPKAIRGKIIK